MPSISMEKFPTFFGNASEDAKQHLIKFNNAYNILNVAEENVACQLFMVTLQGSD